MKFRVKLGLAGVTFMALMVFLTPIFTGTAAALDPGGRSPGHDYFTNANSPGFGGSVIVGGLPSSTYTGSQASRKSHFINFIESTIRGGGRDGTGGQFIVQLMRGATDHSRPSAADITAWEALINQGDVNLFEQTYSYSWDSAADTGNNDDYFFKYGSTLSAPTLLFSQNGRVVFAIRLACANPIGDLPGIAKEITNVPPHGAITSVNCSTSTGDTVVKFTYGDNDTNTISGSYNRAYIRVANTATTYPVSGDAANTDSAQVTIPKGVLDPYTSRNIFLYVLDRNPTGADTYSRVDIKGSDVPCVGLSCGSYTLTPAQIDPYTVFNVTVRVNNNVGAPPPGDTITLSIDGIGFSYSRTQPATGSGGVSTASFTNLGPTNSPGKFRVNWTFRSSGGLAKACGFSAGNTSAVIPVAALPYLSVFGGDVQTGSSPTDGHVCSASANTDAGAYSWNRAGVPAGNFAGAGAQYAVMALGQIQGFASSLGTGTNPARLAFANTLTTGAGTVDYTGSDLFGGGFGGSTADCDFTAETANTSVLPTTVSGTQIMYVTGDVFINQDIKYGNSWGSLSAMPYFKLVVTGGNIYIGKNVKQLDGLYVAEPSAAKPDAGVIYTCSHAAGDAYDTSEATLYPDCNKQLVINGSFVARSVQFLRTFGSLGQATMADTAASSKAAEKFNYSPEMWLPRNAGEPSDKYDSITGLPPVL